MMVEEEKCQFLNNDSLEELAPLLSQDSFENLQLELKRLKDNSPPASGIGIDHPGYIPEGLIECKEKIRRLQERLSWSRQICFLSEIIQRDGRRKIKILEKENQRLKEKLEELKSEVERTRNQLQTALGLKKSKSPKKEPSFPQPLHKKKRGAPKGHIGKTRPIPVKVDKVEVIPPPDKCPHCNSSHIIEGNHFLSKYIEDVPPVVKTTLHRKYMKGTCAHCNNFVIAPEAMSGPPVTVGPNLITLFSVMRQQMGVSYRKLGQFSTETLQIPLAASAVLGIMNRVSKKLEPVYKGIEASLKVQPLLHGDETGWPMDGKRWYLWCFCNRDIVYFHPDPSRGSKVPKAIIGEDYDGVMHADFYAAYNFFKNIQRCLIHFLRTTKEELEVIPNDKNLLKLKEGMQYIIEKGMKIKSLPDSLDKKSQIRKIEQRLQTMAKIKSDNKKTGNLVERIKKHDKDLLRFVHQPDVEFHNNRAERSIRAAVIFRKISFGSRTPEGAKNYAILSSVLETCRLKGKKLTRFLLDIMATPDDLIHLRTKSLLDTS